LLTTRFFDSVHGFLFHLSSNYPSEAMGFRRITYYPDRPDNMAIFERIRIEADKDNYPVLLSNGNLVEQGDVVHDEDDTGSTGRRHFAIWSDPFPKPSYLFCAVVGKLGSIQDSYTTMSGRKVQLEIFSEPENVNKLDYAMESLKRSMEWDEKTYGLEYDLDLYNIVAVNDFNMVRRDKTCGVFSQFCQFPWLVLCLIHSISSLLFLRHHNREPWRIRVSMFSIQPMSLPIPKLPLIPIMNESRV
jgi:hypothetical protein